MLRRLSWPSAVTLLAVLLAILLDARVALRGSPEASAESMTKARALLEARARPGDLVIHSPLFSVAELSPLGAMRASPALPAPELRATRPIWVLDVARWPMHGFGEAEEEIEIDGPRALLLRRFVPKGGGAVALFDLHANLERAAMFVERPERKVTCNGRRSEGGVSCPGEPEWLYLARRELVIGGKSTACVWAHPTTGGAILIELPAMPPPPEGRGLELRVQVGMTDDAVNTTPDGAEVQTEVLQDGVVRSVATATNRIGFTDVRVGIAGDRPTTLRITAARDGRRHHCVNAWIVEAP